MCENGLKRISEQELREIQIEILDEVDNFCRNHAINYWIDCGTLLGAVRHKGYIPWDDDIDVGMLRDDYNRFAKEFNQKGKRYRFFVRRRIVIIVMHKEKSLIQIQFYMNQMKQEENWLLILIFSYMTMPPMMK